MPYTPEQTELILRRLAATTSTTTTSAADISAALDVIDSRLDQLESASLLNAWVNVRDHGAVGDGVTDDSAAFQEAVDFAAGGGSVYVPAGDYYLPTPVILPSHTTVNGTGYMSRLLTSLTNAQNIFRNGDESGLAAPVENVHISGLRFDGRRKTPGFSVPGSKSRLNSLLFLGNLDTGWSTNLSISDCWFDEACHIAIPLLAIDGIVMRNLHIVGNGLDSGAANYAGNVDGIFAVNCRNVRLFDSVIYSGDNMFTFETDADAVGPSYGCQVRNIRGGSMFAYGIVLMHENSSTEEDVYDCQVTDIQYEPEADSWEQGIGVRAIKIGTTADVYDVSVSGVTARDCGNALDLSAVSDVRAVNIAGHNCYSAAVRVTDCARVSLSNVRSYNSGRGATGIDGVDLNGCTDTILNGFSVTEASRYGVHIRGSGSHVSIDNGTAIGCGKYTTGNLDRGGVGVADGTDIVIGAGVFAADDGNTRTKYGLHIAEVNTRLVADPANFTGTTYGVYNPAGAETVPGGPIAWANITDNGSTATLVASKNVSSVTRNARGDYTLNYNGQIYRPADAVAAVVVASAEDGVNDNTVACKAVSHALGSVRVKAVDDADTLVPITAMQVAVFGTYYTR